MAELTNGPGQYNAEVYNENTNSHIPYDDLSIFITVEETFDNDHRVVSQKGAGQGRFTFSAADSGDHRICFTPLNFPSSTFR